MSLKKKVLTFSLVFVFIMMATTLTISAQTIRLSHGMSPDTDSPTHAYAVAFKDYIEANTDMKVDIYSDNVLGGQQEVMEQTAEGDIQVTQVSIGGLSHYSDRALIYNFPYAYPEDNRVAYELWQRGNDFTNDLFDDFEEESEIKPIHVFPRGGGMALTNSKRAVSNLEDIKGIKFRSMDQMQNELYESLGASGTSVPWEELYNALQTGVADGQL
ncbi:MAG: TRAP transporter substrate-binding protein DctP, partial [bacterium]